MCILQAGHVNSGLRIKRMPSSVVIKNFVSGISDSNYEILLRGLSNSSTCFFGKSGSSDTFFTVEYSGEFLIFQYEQGAFLFVEAVSTFRMPTYERLLQYGDMWGGAGTAV